MKTKLQLVYYGKEAAFKINGVARYVSFAPKRSDRESHVVDFAEGYALACEDAGVEFKWKGTKLHREKVFKAHQKGAQGSIR